MKKLLAVLLVLIILLSACTSRKPDTENETDKTQSDTESETDLTIDDTEVEEESEPEPITKTLVVPEGYTLARIGMRLEEMEVCTVAEFILAAQMGDFSEFPLVAMQKEDPNRCFILEGYLFPDTYEIYSQESPDSIIRRMLANTEKKINAEIRKNIENSGFTVDEILTIASIIEKEAYERSDVPVPEEMPRISSVIHNRLRDGSMIECNVTATYVKGAIDPFVSGGKERYNEFYNTYHAPALPPGAICNPGLDAINSAIFPADTNYLFFLTDDDKNFYYSEDYEEHKILVKEYLGEEG